MPRSIPKGNNLGKLLLLGSSEHSFSLSLQCHNQIARPEQEPHLSSLALFSELQFALKKWLVAPQLCEVADADP